MVRDTHLPGVVVYSGRQDLPSGVSFLSSPLPPHSFTCTIFRAVFDSCSSFFAPKPHRNACFAGYSSKDRTWFVNACFHIYWRLDSLQPVPKDTVKPLLTGHQRIPRGSDL